MNRQTRLYTYVSTSSVDVTDTNTASSSKRYSFRRVFSARETSRNTFTELPGCINYAHLKICERGIALRTETGIYYGTIDRSDGMGAEGKMLPWNSKGGSGVVDAGILPYESTDIPTSISITPHHFITLSETR